MLSLLVRVGVVDQDAQHELARIFNLVLLMPYAIDDRL
jgi:hypothetical protein